MSRLTDEQTIQVRINTAVDEALSANNAKWREKIEERNGFCELGGGINIGTYPLIACNIISTPTSSNHRLALNKGVI